MSYSEQIEFNVGTDAVDRYIMIRNDAIREDLENFEVRLQEPENSDLGMPDMATVFIQDDEGKVIHLGVTHFETYYGCWVVAIIYQRLLFVQ